MGSFLTIDSHFRSAIFIILTSLNLHKNNIFSIYGDNINFPAIGTPVPLQYLIAFFD